MGGGGWRGRRGCRCPCCPQSGTAASGAVWPPSSQTSATRPLSCAPPGTGGRGGSEEVRSWYQVRDLHILAYSILAYPSIQYTGIS